MNGFESYEGPSAAPDGCDPLTLPGTTNAYCPNDYNAYESEITDIWIAPVQETSEGSGEWEATATPANWESKADLNATTGIEHLTVIGDKPLAEPKIVTLARKWTKVTERNHQVNIDVTDMSEENYEFIRTLQHGGFVAIWWWSYGGWVAGGANGIICQVDTSGIVWGRGDGTLMTGQLIFKWVNLYDPPAVVGNNTPSPLKVVKPGPDSDITEVKGTDVTGDQEPLSGEDIIANSGKRNRKTEETKAA